MPRIEIVLRQSHDDVVLEQTDTFCYRLKQPDGSFIYSDGQGLWQTSRGAWFGVAPTGWDDSRYEVGEWSFVRTFEQDYS